MLFFHSSLEQHVTTHVVLSFASSLEQRVTTLVVFSFAAHWNNMLRHMLCFSLQRPLEQRVATHVVLSFFCKLKGEQHCSSMRATLQLKASMVCDSHSHVSCAGTLCFHAFKQHCGCVEPFPFWFLSHPRNLGIANRNLEFPGSTQHLSSARGFTAFTIFLRI